MVNQQRRQLASRIRQLVSATQVKPAMNGAIAFAFAVLGGMPAIVEANSGAASVNSVPQALKPQIVAQRARIQRIQFAPGTDSSTVEDAVVRGTRNIYLIGANKGQTLTIKITSIENNAVFDVAAPSGRIGQRRLLLREASEWSTVLPTSGDYQIIVGSTRGNSTFRLQISIR
jgi:hypothetical protein